MSRQRAVCTVHSFIVWIIAVACWYACAKLSVVRSLPDGGNCLELTFSRVWTIFKIENILCEMIYIADILSGAWSWILPSHSTILPATTCRVDCQNCPETILYVCVFCCFVCFVLLCILCFLCINCVYNYKKIFIPVCHYFQRSQTATDLFQRFVSHVRGASGAIWLNKQNLWSPSDRVARTQLEFTARDHEFMERSC